MSLHDLADPHFRLVVCACRQHNGVFPRLGRRRRRLLLQRRAACTCVSDGALPTTALPILPVGSVLVHPELDRIPAYTE